MKFQAYKNRIFNSIELELYKSRLKSGKKEFAVCIEVENEIYIVLGDHDKDKAIEKAKGFSEKYKVHSYVNLFKKESDNSITNKLIYNVDLDVSYIPRKLGKSKFKTIYINNNKEEKEELDLFKNKYLESLNTSN